MPVKDWLYRLQPFQLYIILCLSIAFFLVQLFLSHISHALTLLVQSYHMLCNIIALGGCILTLKHSSNDDLKHNNIEHRRSLRKRNDCNEGNQFVEVNVAAAATTSAEQQQQQSTERSLRNTFGWTRIDVLTMLVVCIFLASLCFSIFVEALQTIVHLDHAGDTMHFPIYVALCGILGLVLNAMCYAVIGGYTFHQGSFLSITSAGDVILNAIITDESVKKGDKRLSVAKSKTPTKRAQSNINNKNIQKRQNSKETCRDVCSSVFVIVCAVMVYFCPVPDSQESFDLSKYIDPVMAVISCVVLLYFSFPFMKESGLILLQTIPNTIDINSFKSDLLDSFKDIVNVHDLHVWQLTGSKYVSTAHIIFYDHAVYAQIMDEVINYFHEQGFTHVTIQPEFQSDVALEVALKIKNRSNEYCLMPCRDKMCQPKICCMTHEIDDDTGSNKSFSCCEEPVHKLTEISSVITELETVTSCISLNETSEKDKTDSSQMEEIDLSEKGLISKTHSSESEYSLSENKSLDCVEQASCLNGNDESL